MQCTHSSISSKGGAWHLQMDHLIVRTLCQRQTLNNRHRHLVGKHICTHSWEYCQVAGKWESYACETKPGTKARAQGQEGCEDGHSKHALAQCQHNKHWGQGRFLTHPQQHLRTPQVGQVSTRLSLGEDRELLSCWPLTTWAWLRFIFKWAWSNARLPTLLNHQFHPALTFLESRHHFLT
jgi:hypothetical protein